MNVVIQLMKGNLDLLKITESEVCSRNCDEEYILCICVDDNEELPTMVGRLLYSPLYLA
jgi:hypothetical protein